MPSNRFTVVGASAEDYQVCVRDLVTGEDVVTLRLVDSAGRYTFDPALEPVLIAQVSALAATINSMEPFGFIRTADKAAAAAAMIPGLDQLEEATV